MEFLYPGFLYALAALAVPVIIHLFNFRRFKKIPFTNVRFLREIKTQTQARNKIRNLLILLTRLFALAFLVFAFAQPYIPEEAGLEKGKGRAVSIFVDNSFSMEGESEAGPLLEVAKNRAIDIAMAYEATDRFQILTQDFEGKHQRFVSRNEFIEWVQEIEISPQSQNLAEIVSRQHDLLKKTEDDLDKEVYLISDFQKSAYAIDEFIPDTSISYSLVYLDRNSPSNLFIDSVWFPTPVRKAGDAERLIVRIRNAGNSEVENVPLRLRINDYQEALGSFAIPANSSIDTALSFVHGSSGIMKAVVEIDDYPVSYDDAYYLGYKVFDKISVLGIQEEELKSNFPKAVYAGDSSYVFSPVTLRSVDYSTIPENDLVILNELKSIPGGLSGALTDFLRNGGSVWVIPGKEIDRDSYNSFLASAGAGSILDQVDQSLKVNSLNTEHPLLAGIFEKIPRNIDLPSTSSHYKIGGSLQTSGDQLMGLQGGDAFLNVYASKQGKLYLQAVPLTSDKNNFSRHAIFVASALRMAELSRSTAIYAEDIGQETVFSIPGLRLANEAVFRLVGSDKEIIPQYQAAEGRIQIAPGPELDKAGNYLLVLGTDTVTAVGMNYKREESNLTSYDKSELEETISNMGRVALFDGGSETLAKQVSQRRTGTELWKICLILALVFLLFESLLLRIGKRTLV